MQQELYEGQAASTFEQRGYGFLFSTKTREEIFFHRSDVIGDFPQRGDYVTFNLIAFRGRTKAINVRIRTNDGGAK